MTIAELSAPTRLTKGHDPTSFDCGTPVLNDWLRRRALKNEISGASRTYVVCMENTVVGYYCLATGGVARANVPKRMQRNMPNPIPVIVLGRLAVDQQFQGKGIGGALLRDAVLRVLQASEIVGIKAVFVHAISEEARRFYLAQGFLESDLERMTLCLPLEAVEPALAE